MGSVAWIGFAAGVVILLITAGSVLGTLIVPRATAPRLTVLVTRTVRRAFLLITDRVDAYRTRDRIDALAGPALEGGEQNGTLTTSSPQAEQAALKKLTANWRSVMGEGGLFRR